MLVYELKSLLYICKPFTLVCDVALGRKFSSIWERKYMFIAVLCFINIPSSKLYSAIILDGFLDSQLEWQG